MLWLLMLHIASLLFWAASLVYLPALLAARHGRGYPLQDPPHPHSSRARVVFTLFATPAALVAIMAGTGVFVLNRTIEPWLIIKLTLVSGLVLSHALLGLLLVRSEAVNPKPVQPWIGLLGATVVLLMTAIIWVVLAKPSTGGLL